MLDFCYDSAAGLWTCLRCGPFRTGQTKTNAIAHERAQGHQRAVIQYRQSLHQANVCAAEEMSHSTYIPSDGLDWDEEDHGFESPLQAAAFLDSINAMRGPSMINVGDSLRSTSLPRAQVIPAPLPHPQVTHIPVPRPHAIPTPPQHTISESERGCLAVSQGLSESYTGEGYARPSASSAGESQPAQNADMASAETFLDVTHGIGIHSYSFCHCFTGS